VKNFLKIAAISIFLLSCADAERDNPNDERATNYSKPAEPSSSSSDIALSSSSEESSSSGTKRLHYGKEKEQFCDERDGKEYVYVVIGMQTWMAENLNYDAEGSKCYNDSLENCAKYGRLYDWATAMNNSASSSANPSRVRGICPAGWHLPSKAEWNEMTDYIGGESTEGIKLKAKSDWGNYGNGIDDYGFSALPGGFGSSGGYFGNASYNGYWWSAEDSSYSAYYRFIRNDAIWSSNDKSSLFSVRCVKDR